MYSTMACSCGLGITLCRTMPPPMGILSIILRRTSTEASTSSRQLPIITVSQWSTTYGQTKQSHHYTNSNTRTECCPTKTTSVKPGHQSCLTGGQTNSLTGKGKGQSSVSSNPNSIFVPGKSNFTSILETEVLDLSSNSSNLTRSPSILTRNALILTKYPSIPIRNRSTFTRNLSISSKSPSMSTRYASITARSLSLLTTSPSPSILTPRRQPYSTSSSSPIKLISKEQAGQLIKPNSVVFVEGVVGTPKVLLNAMYNHIKSNHIQGVTVLDVFSLYPYDNMTLDDDCVRRMSFFVSPYTRQFVNKGKCEYIPIMLNDLPLVFDHRYYTPDVALISVSPPDDSGYVSLSTNVTELHSVIQSSKLVVAQINDKMPRSLGDALLHVDQIDYGVEVSYDLIQPASETITDVDSKIANLICDQLIEDEATLQIGLGKIPEAILTNIKSHKNLGIHTELLTPGVLELIKSGIITNTKKTIDVGQITATLLLGDTALNEFVHNNELVQMKRVTYSNNPAIIRQNHRMTAINTCLEIDLTGQVVSDSLGTQIYSGFGGQVDFMRGSLTGLDGRGKAILAFASTDEKSGKSKIVSTLKPGAGVVCSRAHVNYIVTEYGIADLFAKTTRQRAHQLIQLAHPRHREALEKEAFEILGTMPCA